MQQSCVVWKNNLGEKWSLCIPEICVRLMCHCYPTFHIYIELHNLESLLLPYAVFFWYRCFCRRWFRVENNRLKPIHKSLFYLQFCACICDIWFGVAVNELRESHRGSERIGLSRKNPTFKRSLQWVYIKKQQVHFWEAEVNTLLLLLVAAVWIPNFARIQSRPLG